MRLLLIDHGCCDLPDTRVHHWRRELETLGVRASVCGPSTVSHLKEQHAGLHGIHLHDIAAASGALLKAVQSGESEALLNASATVSPRLLGLIRETARQMVAEAVDTHGPDVIFVLHAGILTDLAIETGIPVAVHVSLTDLAAAGSRQSMRDFITSSLGSCNAIVAADVATAELLGQEWLSIDSQALDAAASRVEVWPLEHGSATAMLSLCHRVLDRRREAGHGFFAARE